MLILSQLVIQLALYASTGFGGCFAWTHIDTYACIDHIAYIRYLNNLYCLKLLHNMSIWNIDFLHSKLTSSDACFACFFIIGKAIDDIMYSIFFSPFSLLEDRNMSQRADTRWEFYFYVMAWEYCLYGWISNCLCTSEIPDGQSP